MLLLDCEIQLPSQAVHQWSHHEGAKEAAQWVQGHGDGPQQSQDPVCNCGITILEHSGVEPLHVLQISLDYM